MNDNLSHSGILYLNDKMLKMCCSTAIASFDWSIELNALNLVSEAKHFK